MTSADDAGVVEDMMIVLIFIFSEILFVFQNIIVMKRRQITKQNIELSTRHGSWQLAEAAGFLILAKVILKMSVPRQPQVGLSSDISHFLRIKQENNISAGLHNVALKIFEKSFPKGKRTAYLQVDGVGSWRPANQPFSCQFSTGYIWFEQDCFCLIQSTPILAKRSKI